MKAHAGPVTVTNLQMLWSTTALLGENQGECNSSSICSNIFPLFVIMKHLFCIVIHESWSLHLIGVINQYADISFLHNFGIFCSPQGDCGLDVLGGRRHRVRRQLRLNLHSLASICWKVVPVVIYYLTYSVARVQRQQYQKLKLQISAFFSIF